MLVIRIGGLSMQGAVTHCRPKIFLEDAVTPMICKGSLLMK